VYLKAICDGAFGVQAILVSGNVSVTGLVNVATVGLLVLFGNVSV
jgi:hypothetical protein